MVVGALMAPCPHTVYPALRAVTVAALIAGTYSCIAAVYSGLVAAMVGMLPVLGERCCKCHHHYGDH